MKGTQGTEKSTELDYESLSNELLVAKSKLATSKKVVSALEVELENKATTLKEANLKLKKYNELLVATHKVAKIGVWEVNLKTMDCFWSKEVYKIHEVPFNTEINIAQGIGFYHPEDQECIKSAVDNAIEERKGFDVELRIVTAKKKVVWVRSIGIPIVRNNKIVSLQGVFQDIDERKRTEDSLRESRELFRNIFESAAIGVALVDGNGKPILANLSLQNILGYTESELKHMHFADFTHPEDVDKDIQLYQELLEDKIPSYRIDKRYVRKDGEIVWAVLSVSLIHDSFNKPKYAIGMVEDVTAEKQNEIKLLEAKESLKIRNAQLQKTTNELDKQLRILASSNRDLEEFAFIASHDLQEPLRVISNYSQLLKRRYKSTLADEAQDFLTYIIDGTQRMQKLIRDLLGYSKVGRKQVNFELVNVSQVITDIFEDLQLTIDSTQAQIHFDDDIEIRADPVQLRQLLQNLISNAIKYRNPNESPHIFIKVEDDGDYWLLSVADNGIGIEKQYSEKIFQVFQRLHPKEKYEGTGIGLAICKKIVERHQGKIWLKSIPGKGSVFCFTILKN